MPTTCGFPNCKFRSRYRGSDDSRHFYRVPKKPPVLREKWLEAIGRTEQTIVSQLRVCSGHFHGGEKKEGDVPVADPSVDAPIKVELPPKTQRSAAERRHRRPRINATQGPPGVVGTGAVVGSGPGQGPPGTGALFSKFCKVAGGAVPTVPSGPPLPTTPPFLNTKTMPPCPVRPNFFNGFGQDTRPLVALLDGRDCTVEMAMLRDVAFLAFCDATKSDDLHERVLEDACGVFVWSGMRLDREDLRKFKKLRLIVKVGTEIDSIDVQAASDMDIAVSHVRTSCVEEQADSALCHVLNLYRRVSWLQQELTKGEDSSRAWQSSQKCPRIRGQTLGLLGLGKVGLAVALRAKAFGFNVVFYDPNEPFGVEWSLHLHRVESLDQLLQVADCVSVHWSQTSGSQHLLTEESISRMKKGSFIVNVESPGAVDEFALARALECGHIAAASVDALETRSMTLSPLRDAPNVVLTPAASGFSSESIRELREDAAKEMMRGLMGSVPDSLKFCVNAKSLSQCKSNFPNGFTFTPFDPFMGGLYCLPPFLSDFHTRLH